MLTLSNVSKDYNGPEGVVCALKDVTVTIEPGEFVAVRGPSGSGKTTLLLAAGGLLQPDRGEIMLDGTNPYTLAPDARARFRVSRTSFVFQQFHLIPYLDVFENILASSLAAGSDNPAERARQLMARFNIDHRRRHVPAELSTGEKQRVALARALLNRPKLLLADEPTGNIDEQNGRLVIDCFREFAESGGAVMMVTHDRGVASDAQRTIELSQGAVVGN